MQMRYPEPLKKRGTVGFAAPSFGAAVEPYRSAFKNALKYFEAEGYSVQLGPNCFAGEGTGISNLPSMCGKELTDIYCSSENGAVISVGGGELMCEILDHIDFEKVRNSPAKWFMGYSDNTNFTFLLNTLCDTASIYGPCAPAFGMEPLHPALSDAFSLITGKRSKVKNYEKWERESLKGPENPLEPFNCTEDFAPVFYDEKGRKTGKVSFKGRMIGGCVDCLINICGTKFDMVSKFCEKYKDDGIVWFLESCDLNTVSFRRAMWQLKHAGWFKYVRGFIFGRPYLIDDCSIGLSWEDAVFEHIKDLGVPCVRDADLGHLPPMMPVISGSFAKISCETSSPSSECDGSAAKPSVRIEYIKR